MLLAGSAAWYFVGKLPPTFKSSARISAGIFEFKGKTLTTENAFIQQYEIDARFNQLIRDMTSRRSIQRVTKSLLDHDLKEREPFRLPDEEILSLSTIPLDDFALVLQTNFDTLQKSPALEKYYRDFAEAFGYDYESIMDHLVVLREGDTDYVTVSFESESPELSYFVVENFCKEFLSSFEIEVTEDEENRVAFYTELVNQKKSILDSLQREINNYKSFNGLIDVGDQSTSVISHIRDYEAKQIAAKEKIPAIKAAIADLEKKIFKYNRSFSAAYAEDLYSREDFFDLDQEIKQLKQQILEKRGNTNALSRRMKKLEGQKAEVIAFHIRSKVKDDHPIHDQVKKWIQEKSDKEIELQFARESADSYAVELQELTARAGKLQRDDAYLKSLEASKATVEKQYNENLGKLEDAKLEAGSVDNPLSLLEKPELAIKPESNHRAIISAFSGVAGGTMASIFIFLLALMDSTIQSPSQFPRRTKLPFLGFVNKIKTKKLDLNFLFHSDNPKNKLDTFRESIRKLRSILEATGKRSFLFVSPKNSEGKSFLIILLAYALSLNNKRVLIIDTNFRNNSLSNYKNTPFWTNTGDGMGGLVNNWIGPGISNESSHPGEDNYNLRNVDIIGNKGGNQSPSEVLAGKDFERVIRNYSTRYDYIFLEAASMNQYSDAMELMRFVDKVVAVFSAEATIGGTDRETLAFLRRLDSKFLGGVLNFVDLKNIT